MLAKREKADLFHSELKVLGTNKTFHDNKIETLSKSLEELQSENNMLNEKIITLCSHKAELKTKWEKEQVAAKIAQDKEQFKRCVPPKRSLGYVEPSSKKCVHSSTRSPRSPKATKRRGCCKNYCLAYF